MPRGRKPGSSARKPGMDARCSKCEETLSSSAFRTRTVQGHIYLRSVCKTCERPKTVAAIRRWQDRNRDRVKAASKRFRLRHPDRARETCRRWRTENRERYNAMRRVRRSRMHGSLTLPEWEAIVAAYDERCAYCGAPWEHMEHVVPICRGGAHAVGNVVPACARF